MDIQHTLPTPSLLNSQNNEQIVKTPNPIPARHGQHICCLGCADVERNAVNVVTRERCYSRRVSKKPPIHQILRGRAGSIINATDRIYYVTANGNFVRGYISQGDGKFHQKRRVRNHQRRKQKL